MILFSISGKNGVTVKYKKKFLLRNAKPQIYLTFYFLMYNKW